jgi:choline dehydrogenase-like flavoprotein
MICDLASDGLPEELETDVCVIGAGPAGITVGLTLARRNLDVILLESGGREIESESQELFDSEVAGMPHSGVHNGRFRAFGGSSKRWGGQILPLFPIDFEQRGWVKCSGWPLRFADLEPYFGKALSFEGLDHALTDDTDVWRTIGLEPPRLGEELQPFLSRWCPEPDFARLHGKEIQRLSNLRCVLHATVTALEAAGGRIRAVVAKSFFGHSIRVRARRFVLCLGGIETPRLLLHPLTDGSPPVWASDLVGSFFQDHPGLTCGDIVPRDNQTLSRLFEHIYFRGLKYQPRMMLGPGKQSKLCCLNAGGSVIAISDRSQSINRLKAAGRAILQGRLGLSVMRDAAHSAVRSGPFMARWAWRTLVSRRSHSPADLGFRLGVQIEQPPRRDSRVSLSCQIDRLGMRRARLDWRVGQQEVETVARFAESVKTAFERMGIADVHIDGDVAARSTEVLDRIVDQNHHMGAVRMADTQDRGVVDSNLKIFRTANGYVCSSAVFPTSSFSNPTHTLVALAVRLGNHLERTPADL